MQKEQKINNFIEKLKNFDSKILNRKIFNPWKEFDENDLGEISPKTRCQNLKNYLLGLDNPKYILIAESPSTGARYSGIAMTSEKVIKNYELDKKYNLSYSSKNYEKSPKYEMTANKVWAEILKSNNGFALWNAFAFNILKDENSKKRWFETPDKNEISTNLELLQDFIDIFPDAKIIALGKTAANALETMGFQDIPYIRHPSNDFKKEFPAQIARYL